MAGKAFLLGIMIAAACWRPAAAATCLQQVEQVARATGLAKYLPNVPGLSAESSPTPTEPGSSSAVQTSPDRASPDRPGSSPGDASATRATSPESSSSLLSRFGGSGLDNRQQQAMNSLQSARQDGARGDEQGCFAQLTEAKQLLFGNK